MSPAAETTILFTEQKLINVCWMLNTEMNGLVGGTNPSFFLRRWKNSPSTTLQTANCGFSALGKECYMCPIVLEQAKQDIYYYYYYYISHLFQRGFETA